MQKYVLFCRLSNLNKTSSKKHDHSLIYNGFTFRMICRKIICTNIWIILMKNLCCLSHLRRGHLFKIESLKVQKLTIAKINYLAFFSSFKVK